MCCVCKGVLCCVCGCGVCVLYVCVVCVCVCVCVCVNQVPLDQQLNVPSKGHEGNPSSRDECKSLLPSVATI